MEESQLFIIIAIYDWRMSSITSRQPSSIEYPYRFQIVKIGNINRISYIFFQFLSLNVSDGFWQKNGILNYGNWKIIVKSFTSFPIFNARIFAKFRIKYFFCFIFWFWTVGSSLLLITNRIDYEFDFPTHKCARKTIRLL